jgi:hypothetical protein
MLSIEARSSPDEREAEAALGRLVLVERMWPRRIDRAKGEESARRRPAQLHKIARAILSRWPAVNTRRQAHRPSPAG